MKKLILKISEYKLVLISVAFLVIFSFGCAKKDGKEIKIGAILPLTGDAALAGINTLKGIDLAVEEINNEGIDGKKIRVIYEDTQADPKTAVAAINKLIKVDHVQYIIDNSISSVTLAVAPVSEEKKVVLLSTGATAPKISQAGNFIFRIWNSDALEGENIAIYASDILKIKKVSILYLNNDYGIGLVNVFQEQIRKKGVNPLSVESFEQGTQEYRTQLTKILATQPEAIYLVGYSKDCVKIIQQARELKYRGIWLGTTVMLDPTVIEMVKKTKYELYYPVPILPNESLPAQKSFTEKFFAKYKKTPPALADVGYDAVMLFKHAVELGDGYNGEIIQKRLMSIKEYDGASGLISFDENGDVHKPIDIQILK